MADNGGKADQYKKGDRCFAKLKGYPPWPAQVQERSQGKEEKYFLHFYGTHDSAQVKIQNIYPYDDKHISKYGKPAKPSPVFKKAMDEIEANVVLYEPTDALEPVPEGPEEGDLQIDETPPPVLKREGKISAPKNAPKEPAPKPARRLSKSAKRDSFSAPAVGSSSPVIETPPPAPAPQPEIVSRSGRKIKPKRFADDEIGSPVSMLAKAALQSSFDEAKAEPSPPAPKRSKKQKGNGGASPAPAPTLTPEQPVAPAKPKETPELKTRGKSSRATPKQHLTEPSSSIPIPAPRSRVSVPVAATVSQIQIPELTPDIESDSSSAPLLSKAEDVTEPIVEPRLDIDDKENDSASSWVNATQDEGTVSDDSSTSKTDMKQYEEASLETDETSGESLKVALAVKKDSQVEIIYNHDKPKDFPSQKARIEWDVATAKNVLKVRETLETADPTAVELFNLLAAAVEEKESELIDIMEKTLSEKRRTKLQKLRIEGEVIEIIGDVINCLSAGAADCDRAIELLDRLKNHELSPLILKKHPEIVETVQKLRFYEGNAEEWDLAAEQAEEFDEKTSIIREKACKIYESFKVTFGCTPDRSFEKDYMEELQRFREYCSTLTAKEYLNMTEEPSSEPSGLEGPEDIDDQQEYEEGEGPLNGGSMSEGDMDDSTRDDAGEDDYAEGGSEQGDNSRNYSDMAESETDG